MPQGPDIKAPVSGTPAPGRILRPGETCWQLARADRFSVIVDAADYFAVVKTAMLRARHSIMLIGWDFDLRIRLTPDDDLRLGKFLTSIVGRRTDVQIYILQWDMAVLFTLGWETLPMLISDIAATRRIHLRFDSTHPLTAAHHQKIVVIDASIAFCGGIDMTDHRWDTRAHRSDDRHRTDPDGAHYGPWHDATTAVDGDAARALDDLARERWLFATGQTLPRPQAHSDAWPPELAPQLRGVDVGIARTLPAYKGRAAVHEIEHLYIAAIRAARRVIYVESQYFAGIRIAEALMARLQEPDGPEVVVINPKATTGWLQEETMDCARALIMKRIEAADRYGRFGIYYPVDDAGSPIYVHSKVLVIDDCLLRVGSSNINNRSMGFDSECDLAVEGAEPHDCAAIAATRDGLLAEHLDTSQAAVAQAIQEQGSVRAAVESLRRAQGRTLHPLPLRRINEAEEAIVASRIADPEGPEEPESRLEHAVKRIVFRYPKPAAAATAAIGVVSAIGAYIVSRVRSAHRS